jgi:hypothetical protein
MILSTEHKALFTFFGLGIEIHFILLDLHSYFYKMRIWRNW